MKNIFKFLIVTFFIFTNFISASTKSNFIFSESLSGITSEIVLDPPVIIVSPSNLNTFNACLGSASATQTFTISGTGLTNDIIVNAPAGYQISSNNGDTWSTTLTLPLTDGSVTSTTISIRIAAATNTVANNLTIIIASGSTNQNITGINGTIKPLPSITGRLDTCIGSSSDLNANLNSGTWASSNATVATVDTMTGVVLGVAAGTTTITYTINGCSSDEIFTVNALPTASITTNTPITFCQGGSVVLTANTGTGLTYVWKKDGATISGTSSTYSANTSGSYTVTVNNTTTNCSKTSTAVVVTVNDFPIISSSPSSVCVGATILLTGSPTAASSNAWVSSALAVATVSAGVVTGVSIGIVTITYTNTNGCTVTKQITVNALPIATITTTTPTTFCEGGSVVLTANTGTGLSYVWKKDGVIIPSETSSTYTATTSGNYTVTVTNSSGCSKTTNLIVVVNPSSNPDLASGNNATLFTIYNGIPYITRCTPTPSATVNLINNSTNQGNISSYTIAWGDNSTNNVEIFPTFNSNITHTYIAGFYTLTITAITNNNCSYSKNYGVFVGTNPSGSLGIPENLTGCAPYTITFPLSAPVSNIPGTQYVINFGDNTSITYIHPNVPTNVTHTYLQTSCGSVPGGSFQANSYVASLTVTNPCSPAQSFVGPILINKAPTADFSISADPACVNQMVTLTNTSDNGYTVSSTGCISNPDKYWTITPSVGWTSTSNLGSNNGNLTDPLEWSNGANNLSVIFNIPGTYTINFFISNNCGIIKNIVKTICIESPVVPQFTLNPTVGCTPQAVTATNTTDLSNVCSALTYAWEVAYAAGYCGIAPPVSNYYTNGTTAASPSPSFNFVTPGMYSIKVTISGSTCGTVTSGVQTVIVKQPPTVAIDAIANYCGTATISPTAVVNGLCPLSSNTLTYLWSFPGATTVPSGALNAINPVGIVYSTPGTYTVTLKVTNECGPTTVTKIFTVKPLPTATISGGITVCQNVTAPTITFVAPSSTAVTPYTTTPPYIFTYNINGGSNLTVTASTTNTVTVTAPTGTPGTFVYNLVSIESSSSPSPSCSQLLSGSATVVVKPLPVIANVSPIAACSHIALNYDLAVLISGTGDTYTYTVSSSNQAQVPAGNPRTVASAANITDTYTNTTGSDVTITYIITPLGSNGCSGNPFSLIVTIKAEPVVSNQTPITTCSQIALNYNLSVVIPNTGDTYTYTVSSSNQAQVPAGSPRTIASAANITDTYINTTSSDVIITYVITPAGSNGCSGNSFNLSVTVKPEPIVSSPTPITTCSDIALNYDLAVLIPGTGDTYTYAVSSSNQAQVPAGSPRTVASASNITDTYTNTTASDVAITYVITPIGTNGCLGNPFNLVVTIKPEPAITNKTATICSDVALNYDLAVLILGTGDTYTYTVSSSNQAQVPAGSPRTVASAVNITDTYTNTTGLDVIITYVITPKGLNGCSGNSFNLVVTLKAEPVITDKLATTCSNVALNYSLDTLISGTGDTYTYTVSSSNQAQVPAGSPRTVASAANITDTYINTTSSDVIITYVVTGSNGCSGNAFNLSVTVKPEPIVSSPTPVTTCSDIALNYDLAVLIPGTGDTYTYAVSSSNQAQVPAGSPRTVASASNITDTYTNTTASDVAITYVITPIGTNGCLGNPFNLVVTIKPEPAITNKTATICSDVALNYDLAVLILGTGDTYTYTVSSSNQAQVPAGSPRTVASAVNITDTYTNTTGLDVIITYVITPKGLNGCSGNSFNLVVTLKAEPVITDKLATTCSNVALNYSLDTLISGTGDTYTYTVSSSNQAQVPAGSPRTVASAANITDTYINTTSSDVIITYVVTGSNGCSGNSFNLSVTVKPEPIVSSPTPVTTCSDIALNYDLAVLISGTGDTYTYAVSSSNQAQVPAGSPRTVASASNITDTYTNTTASDVAITYVITPIGTNGCLGNPFNLVVTIKPEPAITNKTATICSDVALNYDLAVLILGTGDTYTYTVSSSNQAQVPAGSPRTVASAVNITDTYTNTTGLDVIITYVITPKGLNGCSGNSFNLVVTVKAEPVITDKLATTCSNVALNYSLDTLISGTGDTYTYTVSSSNQAQVPAGSPRTVASAANITDTYINTTSSDVIITYVVTGSNGCSGNSFNLSVTVKLEPIVSSPTPVTTCSDIALNYDLAVLIPGTGDTYTYAVSSSNQAQVPAGSPRTVASASNITDTYTNTTASDVAITYVITPIGTNGCLGNPFNLVVTIKPEPAITNKTATICSDVALNYDLAVLILGTGDTYTYTVSSSNQAQVPAGSPRTVASAVNITDTYTNTTGLDVIITYVITPKGLNGCSGNSFNLVVTLKAEPVITDKLATTCSNVALNYSLDTLISGTGDTYTYTVSSSNQAQVPAGSPRTVASAANITDTYINTTSSDVIITYVVTGSNGCSGNAFNLSVTVKPEPIVSSPTPVTTCSDIALNYDLAVLIPGTGDTYTYAVSSSNQAQVPAGSPRTVASASNITDTYTNTTASDVAITYVITPIGTNGCLGNPFNLVVTIKPEPAITNKTATICSDVALNYDLAVLILGTGDTYTYTVSSSNQAQVPAGSPRTVASAVNITDTYTNTTGLDVIITYVITPKGLNGCSGNSFNLVVTLKAEPVITDKLATTCSNVALNYSLDTLISGTGDTYTYTVSSSNQAQVPAGSPRTVASAANITDTYINTTSSDVIITYVVTGSNGCSGNSFNLSVTVKPEPIVSSPTPVTTCSDIALNYDLAVLISGTGDTYTYAVSSSNQAQVPAGSPRTVASASNITDTYTNTTASDVAITYVITPIGTNGCLGNPFNLVVTIKPEPAITNKTATICSDVALNYDLAVLILGTGDTYTYTVSSSNQAQVPAGSPRTVASAVNITDTYTNTTGLDVIITYVITPKGLNGCSGNSFNLVVTVKAEPVITDKLATTCSNVALNYSLDTLISGTGDTYTYTVSSSNQAQVPAGSPRTVASAANITDTYINTTSSDVIITYVVTGSNGCSGNSFNLSVTVKLEPIVSSPTPVTTCSDIALNYDLAVLIPGTGDTYTYAVSSSNQAQVPAGSPRTVASASNITDTYTNTTASDVAITYVITPIGTNGCLGNPFNLVVTIKPEPAITNKTATICSDVALNYDLAVLILGTGDTYTYTVSSSNQAQVPAGSPRTVASAVNITDTYTNTTGLDVIITYVITPKGLNGCSGNSFNLVVTVKAEPIVPNQTITILSNQPVGVNFNLSSSVIATTYNVTALNLNGLPIFAGGPIFANGLVASDLVNDAFTNTTSNPVNVIYTVVPVSVLGCLGDPFYVTVTVNPQAVVAPQILTICSDVVLGVNFNSSSSVAAVSYNVTALDLHGLTSSLGSNVAVVNGLLITDLANDAFTNKTTAPVDVVYTVVPVSASGSIGNPFTVTVTVKPESVVANQTLTVCSDRAANLALGSDIDGPSVASYSILNINNGGLVSSAGTPVIGSGLTANELLDDAWTNNTSASVNVVYTVVPLGSNGCDGDSFTFTVTVSPEPAVANQTTTSCSDVALGVNFNSSTSVAAATYNVTALNLNGLIVSAGNAGVATGLLVTDLSNDAFTNITNAPVDVIYTVVPVTASGCIGEAFTITATINPEPVVVNQTVTTCSDIAINLVLGDDADGPTAATYNITTINSSGLFASAGLPVLGTGFSANELINDAWTNKTTTPVNVIYTVEPVSSLGCKGNPFTVTLTVKPESVVANQTLTVCSDRAANLALGSDIDGPSVASYSILNINNGGLVSSAGTPVIGSGLTANELLDDAWTNNTSASVNVVYTVVPLGSNGCDGDSFTFTVTVSPEPAVANQTTTSCSDVALGVNFNSSTSVAAATYNVTALNLNGLIVSAGNAGVATGLLVTDLSNDAFTNITNAPVDVIYTVVPVTASGCIGEAFTITATINPEPVVVNQTVTTCSDIAINLVLGDDADGPTAATYNITTINSSGLFASAGLPVLGTGFSANELINDAWTNKTTTPVNVIYTVEPVSSLGCKGNPFTVTLTVKPEPVVANQTLTVCSDRAANLALGSDIDGPSVASYSILNINNGGLVSSAGTPVIGSGLTANELLDDAWTNNTSASVNVVYTVVPLGSNGCDGDSFTFTVTVSPEPAVANQTTTSCSDVALGVNFNSSTSVAAATYNVTALNLNGLIVSAGNAGVATGLLVTDLSNDAFTNITNAPVDVIYTVVPVTASGCIGEAFTITATINPEPVVVNQTVTTCSDIAINLVLGDDADGPTAATYNITTINSSGLFASAGLPVLGTGFSANELINDAWTNKTTTPVNVIYTVEPVSSLGCKGNPFTVTLTVKPESVVANQTLTVCSDRAANLALGSDIDGPSVASYSILNINNGGLVSSAGTPVIGSGLTANELLDDAWTNNTSASVNVVYTVVPLGSNGCDGDSFTFTVTVSPEPAVANQTTTSCSDVALGVNFNSSTSVAAATYNVTALNLNGLIVSAGNAGVATGLLVTDLSNDAFTNITNAPVDVIYTVVPVTASGCIGEAFTITATINPEPVVVNQTVTTCSDIAINLVLGDDADGPTAATYNITTINSSGLFASAGLPVLGTGFSANELINDAWTNKTTTPVNVIYTVEPVSSLGCKGNPFTVTLTVKPEPVVANQTLTVCSDRAANLALGSDIDGPSVASYSILNINNGGLVSSAGTPVIGSGLTANELLDDAWTNNTSASVNVVYTVVPLGSNGCDGDSFTFTVTVSPEPAVANQISTSCSESQIGIMLGNDIDGPTVTLYNIVTIDTNGLVPYGGSPSIGVGLLSNAIYDDAWTNTTNTPKEVVYTVVPLSGLGCEGDSFIVTVTISPKPTIPNQSDIICSGDMFMIAPVNNQIIGVIVPLGTTYTWTVVDNPNVLGETDQLNPQANISQALTNFTSIVQIINYTVTPISGTCQGTPFTLAVSVNPRPFIPNAPQLTDTRCSGEAFNIIPQNGIPDIFTIVPIGTTYIWTVPVNNLGATSSILPGLTSISQVLINPTNTIQSVTYSVTPSSGTCIGIPFNVKIWIEPKPFIPTVLETICNQSAFVLAPINAQLPTPTTIIPNITKYTWGAPTVTGGVTGWATGTDTLFFNSGILDNPTPFIQTVTFHVTPSYYVISNPNVIQCAGDSFDIIVTVNPKVTPQEVITNVLCYNSVPLCAASITLNPIGGIPFSYAWTSLSIPLNPLINPIDRDQFNLCPGDYKLEITDTFNCKYSFIYVVAPPTPIIESLVIHQDISCNNTSIPPCDGYVELAISGGTPLSTPTVYGYNYIFEWYKESTTIPGLFDYLVSTGRPILQNACEGNYRLKTVDANGCILWSQIQTILKLFVPISVVETVSNYNGWSVKCNGDSNGFIHDLISGGSGLYTYTLTNDIAPLVIISSGSISAGGVIPPLNTALNIDNIPAGNYTLTIHDSACPYDIVLQYQLTEPTLLQSSINIINPILCNGGKATYEAAPSGGTFPYSYVWFPSGETTSVATNLPLGPYSCLITDDNGCTITKSGAISEPTALQAVASVSSPILCYGGTASITVTAIGGTGPYTGTGVFTGVSAGISPTYVVTDFNGCQATVSILVPTPSLLEAQAVITNPILCHGGNATITITASGGTPNYLQTGIFSVPAGNHTFVVFDSNGCPASISITVMEPTLLTAYATVTTPILCNGGSGVVTVSGLGGTPTYSGVGTFNAVAGVNTYVINDANGCSIPVTITVNEPTLLVANAVVLNPIKCHGGMATISVTGSGGVSPYVGTGTFQALAGIHTYSIRDANNCIQTFTITITEPTLLVATASITSPILCYGGTAVVSVSAIGGVSPYTVVGNYTVIAGVYSYTVVDANNCSTTATINVTQPGLLAFTIKSVSNPNCFPNRLYDNGTICIKITGGTAPIPVGAGWIQSTTIPGEWCLSGLSAATYTISVTDVNNCPSITRTVSLTRPTPLTAFTTDNVNVNCPTKNVSQTNYVFASGGVPGYVYNWSGGDACPGPINPQCMTTDINGNYFVDVNDQEGLALGCIAVQVPIIVNLPVIGDPLMSISSNASTVCGVYSINDPITFTNISTGNFTSVEWFIDGLSLAGSNLISHNFTTLGDHTITLVVNYTIGGVTCTYSITETIAVTRGYDMVVPNGFTPGNNDGINDNIKPEFNCMGVVEMRVYDTWGSLLYVESGTTLIGWDGKINGHESENGNYIIVVKATTLFGAVINFNGPFTLIK